MLKININKVLLLLAGLFVFIGCENPNEKQTEPQQKTICNPLNLSYRFMPEGVSRREAADPTVITFKGEYYLFASKSGGYWYSSDLTVWTFVETNEIPTEEYAPTAIVLNDEVYFLASSTTKSTIYKSKDPKSGHWEIAKEELEIPVWDPAFYLDDDGKLYLYWGCSNVNPIYGVELDKTNFTFKGETKELIYPNPETFGWEIRGDFNTRKDTSPWLEGAWMNKVNGKYYLQYSAPGTLEKSYADAVYVGESPLGPFKVQEHNSFAGKPEGFACGGGHGNTFEDKFGNYWHVGTITISVKDKFERRIAMYPAFFDTGGVLYSNTTFGDFPMIIPTGKISSFDEIQPNWMLLSYQKQITVSSEEKGFTAANASDEEIRTYWSANSGEKGEWLMIDLEGESEVNAIQINLAEQHTTHLGRSSEIYQQHVVEGSKDGEHWEILVDQTASFKDAPHNYFQLEKAKMLRFVRVTNHHTSSGNFAISDLRVFGTTNSAVLTQEIEFDVKRNEDDRRDVLIRWKRDETATGYNIKYGVSPSKLYKNYQVLEGDSLIIRSLSKTQKYFFRIDSFNEHGTRKGTNILALE